MAKDVGDSGLPVARSVFQTWSNIYLLSPAGHPPSQDGAAAMEDGMEGPQRVLLLHKAQGLLRKGAGGGEAVRAEELTVRL